MLRRRQAGSEFGGLGRAWFTLIGIAVALGGTLQALGPPSAGSPASTRSASANPAPESIAALLSKVEDAITDNPDGAPPGAAAAPALQKVAAALPGASPQDKQLAKDMASDLYDRARIALNAGKVDEEQRWLALGAILAPPPDLVPAADVAQSSGAPSSGAPHGAGKQEFTPNETEAEAAPAPASQAAPPATSANAAGTDQPGAAQPAAAQSAADATAGASGLSIHVVANSAAGATAKALADQLGSDVRTETAAAADAPPGAVICYANPEDHARAKEIGETLGKMGYYWRLQRSPGAPGDITGTHVDVWLPPGGPGPRPPPAISENYCTARLYR